MMKFFTEDYITADGPSMHGLHFEKCIVSIFLVPSLGQNQKCIKDYSSCKKFIDFLVLNFKAIFSALAKAELVD